MFRTVPTPTPRGWRSQAQRNLDNARLAAEEEARRAAERERAASQPPPDEECAGKAARAACPGQPEEPTTGAAAPADDPPPTGEDSSDTEPAEGPPAEDLEDESDRLMAAWLDEHFDTLEAMAQAGEAPVRSPPPGAEPPPGSETPPPPPPPVHVARGDRWNKYKMAEFLRQLAATHSVTAAARAVGMSRRSAYKLRTRLKGQPFDIAWETAFRHGFDNLAHAALELAIEGEEVPYYHQGKLVGTHRKHSGPLIAALLKMRNRMGAPMLGRYGAAAEFWSENWERMVHRVETGSVTWDDEREALGQAELDRLGLPDGSRQADRIIVRNLPDERPNKR